MANASPQPLPMTMSMVYELILRFCADRPSSRTWRVDNGGRSIDVNQEYVFEWAVREIDRLRAELREARGG